MWFDSPLPPSQRGKHEATQTKKGGSPKGTAPIFCGNQFRGVIYLMTVIRSTRTPFSVVTRTVYMPAVYFDMLRIISSASTSAS